MIGLPIKSIGLGGDRVSANAKFKAEHADTNFEALALLEKLAPTIFFEDSSDQNSSGAGLGPCSGCILRAKAREIQPERMTL